MLVLPRAECRLNAGREEARGCWLGKPLEALGIEHGRPAARACHGAEQSPWRDA